MTGILISRLANRPPFFVVRVLFFRGCHGDLWLETRAGFAAVRKWGRETAIYMMFMCVRKG